MSEKFGARQECVSASLVASASNATSFLKDGSWWRAALKSCLVAMPKTFPPALAISSANIALVVGMYTLFNSLRGSQDQTLEQLLQVLYIGAACALYGLVATLWALGNWLTKLTGYARAYMDEGASLAPSTLTSALSEVRKLGSYLWKMWLVATIYLCVPVIPLCAIISFKVLMSYAGWPVALPLWLNALLFAMCVGLTLLSVAYMMTLIVLSTRPQKSPGDVATDGLTICFKHGREIFIVSCIVVMINAVCALPPGVLAYLIPSSPLKMHVGVEIAGQLWIGLSSIIAWPLSVAIFCELIGRLHRKQQWSEN